jgi:catechol 2,3-dioxygenase-like lactoylglutathione lyase family enzyme
MFSHIFVSVTDFARAERFYDQVMEAIGVEKRWSDPERPWAGWHSSGKARPYFVICHPYDRQSRDSGNGQMVAFAAKDRDTVRRAYTVALAHGGSSEGEPGLRPEYHQHYFGAYFRDPDGNKFCVACHEPT